MGGALPAELQAGVVFRNNSAIGYGIEGARGGALAMTSDVLIAVGTIFSGNRAEGRAPHGGALSADFAGALTRLTDTVFASNTVSVYESKGYGGAVRLEAGELRLEGGVLRRNIARMESSAAYAASAGGVSVGAKGKLTLQRTQMSANAAGGVGRDEASGVYAHDAEHARKVRAAHIDCLGSAAIEHCVLEGMVAVDPVERAAAPWFLVGRQSGRLSLVDTSVVVSEGSSEGLLNLIDDAEALMRGCRVAGAAISGEVSESKLGIVNSTFSPALDPSVKTIGPPKCSATVASDVPMCDERASCEPVATGGVQCRCVGNGLVGGLFGNGLRYKPGWPEDGQRCEQDASLRAVLQSESFSIAVTKPGIVANLALSLIVEAQGEAELAVEFNVSMTRVEALSSKMTAVGRSLRIDQPSVSAFGQHIEWKQRPPDATWRANAGREQLCERGHEAARLHGAAGV
jgi:hypothetical protein